MLVSVGDRKWPTYALLDTGANCSAIIEEIAMNIRAPLTSLLIRLGTFNENTLCDREVASFTVSNLTETFSITVNNALVGHFLSTENERPPKKSDFANYPHLCDLEFNELEDKSVGLLLDASYAWSFMTGRVYTGLSDEPIGIETCFGNAIIGPKPDFAQSAVVDTDICAIDLDPDLFAEEIRRIYRHDFISREKEIFPAEMNHMSVNDEKSLEQMNATVTYDEVTKHYSVGLPWRLGRAETAKIFKSIDFYSAAKSRHDKLKKKLQADETLKVGTFQQMNEKIAKGYVKKIDSLEAPKGAPICYLPVHVALHPDKPGKFRICMDAAARVGKHFLNKYLLNGPDFFNRLVSVLFRFRQKRFTLTGDVKDFFYQVKCHSLDRAALRCLWWSDESMKDTVVLEALVHIFGATSSPAVANFVLRHHAEIIKDKYPISVYWAILYLMYVDDLLASVDTEQEALELKENMTKALAEGGFTITKWRSNIHGLSDEADLTSTPLSPSHSQEPENAAARQNCGAGTDPVCSGESPSQEEELKLKTSRRGETRRKAEDAHCHSTWKPSIELANDENNDGRGLFK